MAVNWSYPGIGFSEIDNSIQANNTVTDGVGAIVLDANRGYVNQRILSTSVKKFHENFGDPESEHNYGHFAADQFLIASPQLYAVRATMGDEQYAFIQYPYKDAAIRDCIVSDIVQSFTYVDNNGDTQIKLLEPMKGHVEYTNIKDQNWQTFTAKNEAKPITAEVDYTNAAFCLVDNGYAVYYRDLQYNQDPAIRIVRDDLSGNGEIPSAQKGYYYCVGDANGGNYSKIFMTEASTSIANGNVYIVDAVKSAAELPETNPSLIVLSGDPTNAAGDWHAILDVPGTLTLNGEDVHAEFYIPSDTIAKDYTFDTSKPSEKRIADIMNEASIGTVTESAAVYKMQFFDWSEEATLNQEIIEQSAYDLKSDVIGTQFREITGALYNQQLVLKGANSAISGEIYVDAAGMTLTDLDNADDPRYERYAAIAKAGYSAYPITKMPFIDAKQLAYEQYGKDIGEIYTSAYSVFESVDPTTLTLTTRIIYNDNPNDADGTEDGVYTSKYIFNTYWDSDIGVAGNSVVKAAYISRKPDYVYQPWVYDEHKEAVKPLVAFPTSDIVNDPTGLYKDGYTKTILTVDEPGNGDIERYDSEQNNQLVIAAVAPGEWGNDIGVSIITPEVAGNDALVDQAAAFDWKYLFDDEDLVNKDWMEHPTYEQNPNNLTWKKVYKINVYVKSKTQQASVWGSGLDALVKEPVESFLVSNDPTVKDGNGNSMYAPYVINGQSKYIYVSLSSVLASRTTAGTYAMPKQTYSIYQLTGGKNSTKNEIKEKTAALELYRDRQKCNFDIIFNVEAIETFQSRQKYAAMQNRIASIAIDRGIDIGFIQVTSKAAKTGYKALSEGKLFSFANGSYVAAQAGYDRYYDQYTSNWVYLPKSIALAVAHARCWRAGTPWIAPAGVTNGSIEYSNGQLLKLSDPEIGQLYNAHINCSRTCAGYGELIYGQKTMLKKTSALNRINVRGLVNYIEKHLESLLQPFLFQNNTSTTRSTMLTTVDSFLSGIMAAQGITAKSVVVKPDPRDSHLVYVNISIRPAEAIEFIQVTTTINRAETSITTTDNL